ncbi:MAG: TIGR00341 family protein [Chitinophagaceae bacterium]|nr:TIGR00341 family protein [Chitinophagaceae bacterium]
MENFFTKFKLLEEKEDYVAVINQLEKGVVFRGTNLWVLIFAIFVASLGLNVNSTAVIIGAMLISPLMGPIMGLGLGMGTNDVALLKKALYNFLVATGVALATSTLFFTLSPINEAHSEILARTSPNIYDVLIALFGGLAGMLATSSKNKGNVIPGVAIATALMPPLCTAGYGLATFQFQFFFGAFYLFIINTVFIALATFFVVKFLRFPLKDLHNPKSQKLAERIVGFIVIITLLPSIYFGYDMIQQNNFTQHANKYIDKETTLPNDYLLSKKIDAKQRKITLVYGGREISEVEIKKLESKLKNYYLSNATLEVKQGFAYLNENDDDVIVSKANQIAAQKDLMIKQLQVQIDSLNTNQQLSEQVYKELKAQNNGIISAIVQPTFIYTDSSTQKSFLVVIEAKVKINTQERLQLENWLKVRLKQNSLKLMIEP